MEAHLKIKEIREGKNITQLYMADKMNMSLVSYSKIERGVTELSVKRLYEIAGILGVDITKLLGIETQNIEQPKRINELEKENAVFKAIADDKETIITHLRQKNSQYKYILESSFKEYAELLAEELNIGHIRVLDDNSKDFGLLLSYDNEKGYGYYDQKYKEIAFLLTDDDLQKIVEHLCQNNIFFRVFYSAYDFATKTNLDIISDWFEAFINTEKYREYRKIFTSNRKLRNAE